METAAVHTETAADVGVTLGSVAGRAVRPPTLPCLYPFFPADFLWPAAYANLHFFAGVSDILGVFGMACFLLVLCL